MSYNRCCRADNLHTIQTLCCDDEVNARTAGAANCWCFEQRLALEFNPDQRATLQLDGCGLDDMYHDQSLPRPDAGSASAPVPPASARVSSVVRSLETNAYQVVSNETAGALDGRGFVGGSSPRRERSETSSVPASVRLPGFADSIKVPTPTPQMGHPHNLPRPERNLGCTPVSPSYICGIVPSAPLLGPATNQFARNETTRGLHDHCFTERYVSPLERSEGTTPSTARLPGFAGSIQSAKRRESSAPKPSPQMRRTELLPERRSTKSPVAASVIGVNKQPRTDVNNSQALDMEAIVKRMEKVGDPDLRRCIQICLAAVKCPICLDILSPCSVCTLSCGHSLCRSHTRKLTRCPLCRQATTVSEKRKVQPSRALRDTVTSLISAMDMMLRMEEESREPPVAAKSLPLTKGLPLQQSSKSIATKRNA